MPIFQILYTSYLVGKDSEALPAIVKAAVRNNEQRSITGMLLYSDGNFLQVLEGEKEAVLQTFKHIEKDPRHRDVFVLLEQDIAERQFSSWSMGFKQLTGADLEKFPDAGQVFRACGEEIGERVRPGNALGVLQLFAEMPAEK